MILHWMKNSHTLQKNIHINNIFFLREKIREIVKFSTIIMDAVEKKRIRESIRTFYDMNRHKGKIYTFNQCKITSAAYCQNQGMCQRNGPSHHNKNVRQS